jgi:hypothetical protein
MGINNVIKKDVQNIQSLFLKDDNGKEMYSLITGLESLNYIVRIQVKSRNDGTGAKEVISLFFVKQTAIEDARRWPEAIIIQCQAKLLQCFTIFDKTPCRPKTANIMRYNVCTI